jgi:DNA recombination protein RmuC
MVSARKFETLGAAPEQTKLIDAQPCERIVRDVKTQRPTVSNAEIAAAADSLDASDSMEGFGDFAAVVSSDSDFEGFTAEGDGEGI